MPCLEESWSIYHPTSSPHDSALFPVRLVPLCMLQKSAYFLCDWSDWSCKTFHVSKSMALLLSCISLLCAICYSCTSMNYLYHIILAIVSSTPISSPSVELFLYIFCFVENLDTDTFPKDIISPICPQQSSCTMYKTSTHHFTTDMSPTLNVSFSSLVPLRYFNTRFSFTQASSSDFSCTW